jgi:hypothetical protein
VFRRNLVSLHLPQATGCFDVSVPVKQHGVTFTKKVFLVNCVINY